jgi:photosystem II stability/assembly factor-like uncharacterized protein
MACLPFLILLAQAAPLPAHAVYKSVDRGISWTNAGGNMPGSPRVNSFGAIAKRIFAGTDTGIFSSDDEGRAWRRTSVTARTISFATAGSTVYAGTQRAGLFASHDQGITWNPVTSLASRNIRSLLAAEGNIIAGTDADGVLVSSDRGNTWVAQNAGLPPLRQIFALAQVDGTVFAALYAKGLYAWRRDGRRWIENGNANIKPLALASTNGLLSVGHNPGGIHWNAHPELPDWTRSVGSFNSPAPVWEMASGEGLVLAGVASGIFRSEDGGRNWIQSLQGLPPGSAGVAFLIQGDTCYAGLTVAGGRID